VNCPRCGQALRSKASLYELEVKKIHSDPQWRAFLAPPIARSSIHLFILGLLVWLTVLYPAFAFERPSPNFWRDFFLMGLLTSVWYIIWRRAQRKDQQRRSEYDAIQMCSTCAHASQFTS